MTIDIAVGKSRKEVNWKNRQYTWGQLIARIRNTTRTTESFKEYMNATKAKQDSIKDIGGFVGGYLIDGKRSPRTNIKYRGIITLDIDDASQSFWEDFTFLFGCAAAVYSTHKHSPEKPRYRLLIPLASPVELDEYEAIGRKIAGIIGIDQFDGTTFQPQRLMYWPSTARDAEYIFEYQNGDFLEPGDILSMYRNYKDISEWPMCATEKGIVQAALKKQEDPTLKKGLIGAFCRAYPMSDARDKWLTDVYEVCDEEEHRWTYIGGSTAGGVNIYDDLFSYSWHNTDPTTGQLCNAFDLIRIHKYGHLDEDPSKPIKTLESFKEMMNLINSDAKVIEEIGLFKGLPSGDWLKEMDINKRGDHEPTINNVYLILKNDLNLKDVFAFNQFEGRDYVTGPTPWNLTEHIRFFTDNDDAGLRHYLEKTYNLFNVNKTRDAVDLICKTNSFHPVRDYLNGLVWDKTPRLDDLFIDTLGAEDSEYVRAVTRKTMVAAVARVFTPGIKFDYVLTFVGIQGMRKSALIKELGKEWYSDTLDQIQGKDAYEQLQGVWLLEMAELSSLKRAEVEAVKHFITKQEDRYRVAYGRRVENFPRQCIFFATTNERDFLKDPTGNRRFWPMPIGKRYEEGSIEVDQIWAEARYYYQQGEKLYLDEVLELKANAIQLSHTESDDRVGAIDDYLNRKLPKEWLTMTRYERRNFLESGDDTGFIGVEQRQYVCAAEIWCEVMKGEVRDMNPHSTKFIHSLLQKLPGWMVTTNKRFGVYGYQRAYERLKSYQHGEEIREEAQALDEI